MSNRFEVLDGWRGVSILLVLAAHLLPLGPKSLSLNFAVGAVGMSIFFTLSGFLITNLLIKDQNIYNFLIRRFLRIVPLAWLVLTLTFIFTSPSQHETISLFFFYANWEPIGLTRPTSHFWSLCVEIQFYIAIALSASILKDKLVWVIPIYIAGITIMKVYNGVGISINTYYRIDEILAGCLLATINSYAPLRIKSFLGKLNPIILAILLLLSTYKMYSPLIYFRPYFAMMLIASTLYSPRKSIFDSILKSNFLLYIAGISYALYVIHGGLRYTWLGEGDTLEKYLKRPLLFAVTFILAHASTYYFEKYWIVLGKKLTNKSKQPDESYVSPSIDR